jgi:hypothetical protein
VALFEACVGGSLSFPFSLPPVPQVTSRRRYTARSATLAWSTNKATGTLRTTVSHVSQLPAAPNGRRLQTGLPALTEVQSASSSSACQAASSTAATTCRMLVLQTTGACGAFQSAASAPGRPCRWAIVVAPRASALRPRPAAGGPWVAIATGWADLAMGSSVSSRTPAVTASASRGMEGVSAAVI